MNWRILLIGFNFINFYATCINVLISWIQSSQFLFALCQSSLENIAFPGWNSDWGVDISIDISNSQMVWVNIWLASNNNWVELAELILLSWINWILNLWSPSLLSGLIEGLTGSSQCSLLILESLLRSSHCHFTVSLSIGSTI